MRRSGAAPAQGLSSEVRGLGIWLAQVHAIEVRVWTIEVKRLINRSEELGGGAVDKREGLGGLAGPGPANRNDWSGGLGPVLLHQSQLAMSSSFQWMPFEAPLLPQSHAHAFRQQAGHEGMLEVRAHMELQKLRKRSLSDERRRKRERDSEREWFPRRPLDYHSGPWCCLASEETMQGLWRRQLERYHQRCYTT